MTQFYKKNNKEMPMNEDLSKWDNTPYPDTIRSLPEIDISLHGVRGWLLQGKDNQVVFFDIEPIGVVPEHSHGKQWGIVIAGEMELTIGTETRIYRPGEWYYIPAGTPHSAKFLKRFAAIDYFADRDRCRAK
jgi:quercetin dioxygenase-like cupin family protein